MGVRLLEPRKDCQTSELWAVGRVASPLARKVVILLRIIIFLDDQQEDLGGTFVTLTELLVTVEIDTLLTVSR